MAAADSVTRLLTAFYFRRSGDVGRDEAAFESRTRALANISARGASFTRSRSPLRNGNAIETATLAGANRIRSSIGSRFAEQSRWMETSLFISREVALAWRSEGGETKLGDWQSTFDGLLSWELRQVCPCRWSKAP